MVLEYRVQKSCLLALYKDVYLYDDDLVSLQSNLYVKLEDMYFTCILYLALV